KAARRGLLGAPGHVVRVAEPHRPRARRSRAPEPEQAVDGPAREPTLQVVQRSVDGRARGLLARRQRRFDLVEGEGVVAERHALEPVERGCRRLVVAVDRRGLAEAGDAVVRHLDLDDLGLVLRTARDHERLRQAQRGGACLQLHAVNLIGRSRCSRAYGYAAVSPRPVASTLPVFAGRDVVTDRVPIVASTFHGAPSLIHSDLRRPSRSVSPGCSVRSTTTRPLADPSRTCTQQLPRAAVSSSDVAAAVRAAVLVTAECVGAARGRCEQTTACAAGVDGGLTTVGPFFSSCHAPIATTTTSAATTRIGPRGRSASTVATPRRGSVSGSGAGGGNRSMYSVTKMSPSRPRYSEYSRRKLRRYGPSGNNSKRSVSSASR